MSYHGAVRAFSLVFVALVLIAVTLVKGGGPASVGVLMGLAFLAVGAGRFWLGRKMSE
jgi:hypothetical protein